MLVYAKQEWIKNEGKKAHRGIDLFYAEAGGIQNAGGGGVPETGGLSRPSTARRKKLRDGTAGGPSSAETGRGKHQA